MALFRCSNGGSDFDISTLPAGSCAVLRSGSGIAGYDTKTITTYGAITTGQFNDECVECIANVDGYDILKVGQVVNLAAIGLKKDGTLTPLYAARNSGQTIASVTVTDYDYVMFALHIDASQAISAGVE